MAKEPSRNKDRDIRLSEAQLRHPGMEHVTRPNPSSQSETAELGEEYQYVVADLQRIGIIAVVMLGVLIGLALFVV